MASAAPVNAGWSVEIFGSGDFNLPDLALRLQITAAPDTRTDAKYRAADGCGNSGAGFLDTVAPRSGLEFAEKPRIDRAKPIHLTVNSTGLKIFDEGEWQQTSMKRR